MGSIISHGHDVYFGTRSGAIIEPMGAQMADAAYQAKPGSLYAPVQPDTLGTSAYDFQFWGSNNLLPQQVNKLIGNSPILGPGLNFKTTSLIGQGLKVGRLEVDASGKEHFRPITKESDPEVFYFFRQLGLTRELYCLVADMWTQGNAFVQFAKTADGKPHVARFKAQRAVHVRLGKQKENGRIGEVFVHGDWAHYSAKAGAQALPLLNLEGDVREQFERMGSSAVLHIKPHDLEGNIYYNRPIWHSAIDSRWLEVAQRIPSFKAAVLKNQIRVKYHVEIHPDFWEGHYPGFEQVKSNNQEEANQIKQRFYTELDEHLAGDRNAGKSLFTGLGQDKVTKEAMSLIKITAIQNYEKEKLLIEDSRDASAHLAMFLELPPDLLGASQGTGLGSGSGSDVRVQYESHQARLVAYRDVVLEFCRVIQVLNDWDDELEFRFPFDTIDPQSTVSPNQRTLAPQPN